MTTRFVSPDKIDDVDEADLEIGEALAQHRNGVMLSPSWSKAPRRLVRDSSKEIRKLDHGLE